MKKNSLVMNHPARTELNPSRALEQLEQRLAATHRDSGHLVLVGAQQPRVATRSLVLRLRTVARHRCALALCPRRRLALPFPGAVLPQSAPRALASPLTFVGLIYRNNTSICCYD